jgi:hypothetical protein
VLKRMPSRIGQILGPLLISDLRYSAMQMISTSYEFHDSGVNGFSLQDCIIKRQKEMYDRI